jgi:hypothetical protein
MSDVFMLGVISIILTLNCLARPKAIMQSRRDDFFTNFLFYAAMTVLRSNSR